MPLFACTENAGTIFRVSASIALCLEFYHWEGHLDNREGKDSKKKKIFTFPNSFFKVVMVKGGIIVIST